MGGRFIVNKWDISYMEEDTIGSEVVTQVIFYNGHTLTIFSELEYIIRLMGLVNTKEKINKKEK